MKRSRMTGDHWLEQDYASDALRKEVSTAWNLPPTILNIVMFVIAAIAFTVVMTWVFNNTKGSLFMAVLVHTSFDMVLAILNRLFPVPIVNDYGSNVPVLIGLGALETP